MDLLEPFPLARHIQPGRELVEIFAVEMLDNLALGSIEHDIGDLQRAAAPISLDFAARTQCAIEPPEQSAVGNISILGHAQAIATMSHCVDALDQIGSHTAGENVTETIPLDRMSRYFGGFRAYFLCPGTTAAGVQRGLPQSEPNRCLR